MAMLHLLWIMSVIAAADGAALTVVDISKVSIPKQVAVLTCAGLHNRDSSTASQVYTLLSYPDDWVWLRQVEGLVDPALTNPDEFIASCLSSVAQGRIRYNYTSQQIVLPNLLTLAAVLSAVPLEDSHPAASGAAVAFDAQHQWAGWDAYTATSYMYERHINETTGMSKMNPGLDVHGKHKVNPPLTKQPSVGLTDLIVKERLFNFFLVDGCIPLTKEHALMELIATNNPWPRPIAVFGYDDSWALAGDIFEAETNCVSQHNMGQVASNGLNNLAFFSRKQPITMPLVQNPVPPTTYNASKTYVAFVVGDGDNMNFIKGGRRQWIDLRVKWCESDRARNCFPLIWSFSPHTLQLAPDWAKWYFNQSYRTRNDYFVLPPSGHLYAYPAQMKGQDAANFVTATEMDCKLLNTSGVVDWEWFGTWHDTIKEFYPRYSKRGVVRGLFPVNVPYLFPVLPFAAGEQFKVFDDKLVLFRPNEWRGVDEAHNPLQKEENLSVEHMASKINGYSRGTVSHLYITSDGGANISHVYQLAHHLEEHVQIVDQETLVNMALAAPREVSLIV